MVLLSIVSELPVSIFCSLSTELKGNAPIAQKQRCSTQQEIFTNNQNGVCQSAAHSLFNTLPYSCCPIFYITSVLILCVGRVTKHCCFASLNSSQCKCVLHFQRLLMQQFTVKRAFLPDPLGLICCFPLSQEVWIDSFCFSVRWRQGKTPQEERLEYLGAVWVKALWVVRMVEAVRAVRSLPEGAQGSVGLHSTGHMGNSSRGYLCNY